MGNAGFNNFKTIARATGRALRKPLTSNIVFSFQVSG
jgi:hypothetical protein